MLCKDRLLQTYKKPLYDAHGKPQFLIGVSVDVTERRQAQTLLQHSFEQLRQLADHRETVKEDERRQIAADIHDDLGQNLLALKLDIAMLHQRTGQTHPRLNERAARMLDTIDSTIKSVRMIINDLHPGTLELGLVAATEWLTEQFQQRTGIACTLRTIGDGENIDQRRTAGIFRIMQESLVNIVRHAQAHQVDVSLNLSPDWLAITIADDGIGMRPGDAGKAAAFGLRVIKERVDAFGGELVIDSRHGNGTVLAIRIPAIVALPGRGEPQSIADRDNWIEIKQF